MADPTDDVAITDEPDLTLHESLREPIMIQDREAALRFGRFYARVRLLVRAGAMSPEMGTELVERGLFEAQKGNTDA